jgi:hypothetical protein
MIQPTSIHATPIDVFRKRSTCAYAACNVVANVEQRAAAVHMVLLVVHVVGSNAFEIFSKLAQ